MCIHIDWESGVPVDDGERGRLIMYADDGKWQDASENFETHTFCEKKSKSFFLHFEGNEHIKKGYSDSYQTIVLQKRYEH